MKKTLTVLAMIIALPVMAMDITSEIQLADGTYIRTCNNNGVQTYCSAEDAFNAQRAFQNPSLYSHASYSAANPYKETHTQKIYNAGKTVNSVANTANTLLDDTRAILSVFGYGF